MANLNYSYWNRPIQGNIYFYPGITIENNSSEELVINDYGPVVPVGSESEITNGKDSVSSCAGSEVKWTLGGSGSIRIQGTRQPRLDNSNAYNTFHLVHCLVNPAKLVIANDMMLREFAMPSGSSYGKALVELGECIALDVFRCEGD